MGKFAQKGSVTHILNNLPNEYDVILDKLENHSMAIGDNVLTIEVIREISNHRHEKIKNKNEEKREKEKAF